MDSDTLLITSTSTLLGITITAGFNIWSNHLARKSEERKARQALALQLGFEHYKHQIETGLQVATRARKTVSVPPAATYMVQMLQLSEILARENLTADDLINEMAKMGETSDALIDFFKSRQIVEIE